MNRRLFLASCASAAAARALPIPMKTAPGRRVLTLIYDKSLGMMRAVERIVP